MIETLSWYSRGLTSFFTLWAVGSTLLLVFSCKDLPTIQIRLRQTILWAALGAIVSTLIWISIACAEMAGEWVALSDTFYWSLLWSSPAGDLTRWRIAGLVLLVSTVIWRTAPIALLPVAAVITVVSFSRYGHALSEPSILFSASLSIHLSIAGWWLAVVPLLWSTLKKHEDEALDLATHFGKQAAWVLIAMMLAGGIFALLRFAQGTAFDSNWAIALAIKLVIIIGLLGIGAFNRYRWVPSARTQGDTRSLHRALTLDTSLFVVVVGVSSWMTGPGAMH